MERRAPRGRLFAWLRIPYPADGSEPEGIEYRLFRRDSTGASLMQTKIFPLAMLERAGVGGRGQLARELRAMRAQLRWCLDQVEAERPKLPTTPPPLTRAGPAYAPRDP